MVSACVIRLRAAESHRLISQAGPQKCWNGFVRSQVQWLVVIAVGRLSS